VIQLKSSSPSIFVDHAKLNSKSGVILQMMVNDDPNQTVGGAPAGGGAPAEGSAPAGGAPAGDAAPAGMASGSGAPEGGDAAAGGPSAKGNQDLEAVFKNVTLLGDFYNSLTSKSAMNLTFENATVTGAICTAVAEHAVGPHGEKLVMQDSPDLYYLIGEVKQTCAPTTDAHGATVALKAGSQWVVNKTSYLTGLSLDKGTSISAPKGSAVILDVDGVEKPLAPGNYKGAIVLKVDVKS
jgi:hypothetical protein